MKHVAIVKQYKDIRTPENQGFPNEWPALCEEFESYEAAKAAFPSLEAGRIMSVENYKMFSDGLQIAHPLIPLPAKKPWWKFWK